MPGPAHQAATPGDAEGQAGQVGPVAGLDQREAFLATLDLEPLGDQAGRRSRRYPQVDWYSNAWELAAFTFALVRILRGMVAPAPESRLTGC